MNLSSCSAWCWAWGHSAGPVGRPVTGQKGMYACWHPEGRGRAGRTSGVGPGPRRSAGLRRGRCHRWRSGSGWRWPGAAPASWLWILPLPPPPACLSAAAPPVPVGPAGGARTQVQGVKRPSTTKDNVTVRSHASSQRSMKATLTWQIPVPAGRRGGSIPSISPHKDPAAEEAAPAAQSAPCRTPPVNRPSAAAPARESSRTKGLAGGSSGRTPRTPRRYARAEGARGRRSCPGTEGRQSPGCRRSAEWERGRRGLFDKNTLDLKHL